jgi:hypothetical protein
MSKNMFAASIPSNMHSFIIILLNVSMRDVPAMHDAPSSQQGKKKRKKIKKHPS